ncbi:hypothetical protein D3C81_1886840 [compost metagenome]
MELQAEIDKTFNLTVLQLEGVHGMPRLFLRFIGTVNLLDGPFENGRVHRAQPLHLLYRNPLFCHQ